MKRREFLAFSMTASAALFVACGGGSSSSLAPVKKKALPIPKLNRGVIRNGIRHYDLTIQQGSSEFFEGVQTKTWGINSSYLGDTLLLTNGEEVSINYTNTLGETTTMHGHGMHVPAIMDGGPHQKIAPNSTWSARYEVKQKASTNWYHPHLMGKTAEHVYMGLAGLIIVEDNEIAALDLPKRYGIDDIPLVLQDKVFSNSQIDYSPSMREVMHGYKGDTYLTNGAIEPSFEAESKEIRFRILNASNASIYTLSFSDKRAFDIIAGDNSLLEQKIRARSITLSPAERVEIVVDLSADLGKTLLLEDSTLGAKFLTIEVNKNATATTQTPTTLATLSKDSFDSNTPRRSFTLGGSMGGGMGGGPSSMLKINGKSMDMNRIDERIPLNQVEIWEVENKMMMDHNFHIHATHFLVLERNGSAANVRPWERGYKDVVYLAANDKVKLLVKMVDYSDANAPYMYHCHFLEHEDAGMMGQFVVV